MPAAPLERNFRAGRQCQSTLLAGLLIFSVGVASGCVSLPGGASPSGLSRDASAWNQVRETQLEMTRATAAKARREGRLEEAVRAYEQVRTLAPETPRIDHTLAVLYATLGDDMAAQGSFDRAIAATPADADLLNDYGAFHAEAERWSDAEAWYRKALAIKPSEVRSITNLALAIGMQGRIEEAVQMMTPQLGAAAAHSNAAVILARIGRSDEAQEQAHRALALDEKLVPPRKLLAHYDEQKRTTELKNIAAAGLDQ